MSSQLKLDKKTYDSSFAQLIPMNEVAKAAFAAAVKTVQDLGDEHQLRFYRDDALLLTTDIPSVAVTGALLDPQHAYVNLSLESLPRLPQIGWQVGRGSQDVDIRIIQEKSQSKTDSSIVHFRLFIHPRSGLLCLEAIDIDQPIGYIDLAQNRVNLEADETIVLLQSSTKILVGECKFELNYTVSKSNGELFFSALNSYMKKQYETSLHDAGGLYPSISYHNHCGQYLLGRKIGDGTFGDVRYGVHSKTGEPAALKSIRLADSRWRRNTINEISLLEDVKNLPYCLHIFASWCDEHEIYPKECPGNGKEHFIMATQLALFDFSDQALMHALPFSKTIELSLHILRGIRSLHLLGMMHRDITRKNCLIVSTDPVKAVVGDFGKAVYAARHTDTYIAPKRSCAPEVWEKEYTNAIDLWSWAYMMAECLGYRCEHDSPITKHRLKQITEFLQDKASKDPQTVQLVDLLTKMLIWEPQQRLSIDEALRHYVWKSVTDDSKETKGSDVRLSKKQRLSPPPYSEYESVETVPFSEES